MLALPDHGKERKGVAGFARHTSPHPVGSQCASLPVG